MIIKAGTKIVIATSAGMAGTDNMAAYILQEDWSENQLSDYAWQEGLQWAESFGIYPPSEDDEYDDTDPENISENIEGCWELYDEKEHFGKCSFGSGVEFHPL
jgi:hypothetical protein